VFSANAESARLHRNIPKHKDLNREGREERREGRKETLHSSRNENRNSFLRDLRDPFANFAVKGFV
jgi:hypothetical protein